MIQSSLRCVVSLPGHWRATARLGVCCAALMMGGGVAHAQPQSQFSAPSLAQSSAQSQAPARASVTAPGDAERQTLARVAQYLNSLTTFTASFTQVGPDGGLSSGTFYLQRPGRLRWQYAPPTPILIVGDGRYLHYYDIELEEVQRLPVRDSLAAFLAQQEIRLDGPVRVVDIHTTPGAVRLTLTQTARPDEGSLTLVFSDAPLQLRQTEITDASRRTTTVSFSDIRTGLSLDRSLFIFRDPKLGKRRVR